jgi:alpha-beta hydrolase superfamily lysophospholipase
MADDLLNGMYSLFSWRIASHVPYWDFEQLKGRVETFDRWLPEWVEWARRWARLGDEQLAVGRRLTAGEAYVQAGLFYHWATFLSVQDESAWVAALEELADVWQRAAPLVDPPMEIVHIPFEGAELPGYLRRPDGVERPPLVLLVPGADSSKEELYDLGDQILRRGLAIFAFDGPGHGLVSTKLKLRPDFEVPIAAVLDHLLARADLAGSRVAVAGISYGGLFALRAAAFDDRVEAAVSMSSWYSPAGRYATQAEISKLGLVQYMGDPPRVQDAMTMEGIGARISVPVLQVYGGQDHASPPSEAERVVAELAGPNELVVYEEGVHVVNNMPFASRSLVADWLGERFRC